MAKNKFDQILLVEGNDDQHIVWALCTKFNIAQNFDVEDCKDIDKLMEQIPVRLKGSNIRTLGIIVDADTNIAQRWESLKGHLTNIGYNIPNEFDENGLILEQDNQKKIGIWIMPNNNAVGMIEDFIKFLIPKDDTLVDFVEETLRRIEKDGLVKYKSLHHAKAFIHTWLAWQEDPGTPMGLAITKKYFAPENSGLCDNFINWLTQLYKIT